MMVGTVYVADSLMISPPGYHDVATDYIGNEVALDYNVGVVGAISSIVHNHHRH